jgi:hypothetical protein
MAELYRANVKTDRKVYIHNDLANAAFWYKKLVFMKRSGGGDGLMIDTMACAIMLAFTWEAYLNFFGSELIEGWSHNDCLEDKENKVLERLSIKPDWSKRPYDAMRTLQIIRNALAHGVPVAGAMEDEVINKAEKITARKIDLTSKWQDLCTPPLVLRAYDDLDAIFKEMLTASGLSIMDTITQGEGNISFLEKIEVGKDKPRPNAKPTA